MSTIQIRSTNPRPSMRCCVDCRHSATPKGMPPLCRAPEMSRTFSLVSGDQLGPSCEDARGRPGECTPDGLFFQPIELATESIDKPIDSPAALMASATSSSAGQTR